MKHVIYICIAIVLLGSILIAQELKDESMLQGLKNDSMLTLDRIYKDDEFGEKSYSITWLEDGDAYTRFEKATGGKGRELLRIDAETGQRELLVPASSFIPEGKTKHLGVQSYQWSDDMSKMLIFTNTRRVWRTNSRGDYWVLDQSENTLRQIGKSFPGSSLMFAKFSPDANSVAYVHDHDIYVESLGDHQVRRLTEKSSATIINGTFDWVYEEEFMIRDGFRWSPDGKQIAFWQLDTSEVQQFTIINNTSTLYPKATTFGYPKVGQTNPACRVGIVQLQNNQTTMVDLPGDQRNNYIPRMEWAGNSEQVVLQQLNRLQNKLKIWIADPITGKAENVFTDNDDAWIDADKDLKWMNEGKYFTWSSERDGWNRLYRVDRRTGEAAAISPAGMDVIELLEVDSQGKNVYFTASPENATQIYLYHVDDQGTATRITPGDSPGTHAYRISPNLKWAMHSYSSMNKPSVYELIRLPSHESVRVFEDNKELGEKLQKENLGQADFLGVKIGEVELDSWRILPPDFDPAKKYPLLIYVYGEPAGQTVKDRWGGSGYLWHQMLAQQGYVVMSFDNRGTPAPRGRKWRKSVYRQIGVLASTDQSAAIKAVTEKFDYIDADRVGIWGWSGGGSMSLNAIFRYPELYKMAIAVAPVPNQRYYDTIYQERYMGLPEGDGAEKYKQGSPITFAHQLKGKLMLIHGTGDDNCHYQTMELLINELIKHNKQFSMMAYPNRGHSISEGKNTSRHLRQLMADYILENL